MAPSSRSWRSPAHGGRVFADVAGQQNRDSAMSDEQQGASGVEKQYWHDRRPLPRPPATSSPGEMADQLRAQGRQAAVRRRFARPAARTIPNLRHPIATFLSAVVAVILVGVGVLAISGDGALPLPRPTLASCAEPGAAVLGPPGARFIAAFPPGRVLATGAEGVDLCDYRELAAIASPLRLNGFSVTAVFGPLTVSNMTYNGYAVTPSWVGPAPIAPVFRRGAKGSEAVRCDEGLDWCQGWLRLSRGRAKWVVYAGGNGASLAKIKAFLRTFQPADR